MPCRRRQVKPIQSIRWCYISTAPRHHTRILHEVAKQELRGELELPIPLLCFSSKSFPCPITIIFTYRFFKLLKYGPQKSTSLAGGERQKTSRIQTLQSIPLMVFSQPPFFLFLSRIDRITVQILLIIPKLFPSPPIRQDCIPRRMLPQPCPLKSQPHKRPTG